MAETEADFTAPSDFLPEFMQPGSSGAMAREVQIFLRGFAAGANLDAKGFQCDELYGEHGARIMKIYQQSRRIGVDGGCGSQTRAAMKKDGFDFEAIARSVRGTTIFVQPDGATVEWTPAGDIGVGEDESQG